MPDQIIRTTDQHYSDVNITSGYSLDVVSGASFKLAGTAVTATAATINAAAAAVASGAAVQSAEVFFTETTGAGTYTGTVSVPAGATILDIVVNAVALWNTTTSAIMDVGDAGAATGYYTTVDMKATDLLAGESISFALAGGKAGAYIANSQVSPRYAVAAHPIIGKIISVGAAGTLGRTRMTVTWSVPTTPVAATKT
jgi:hypothetical protein